MATATGGGVYPDAFRPVYDTAEAAVYITMGCKEMGLTNLYDKEHPKQPNRPGRLIYKVGDASKFPGVTSGDIAQGIRAANGDGSVKLERLDELIEQIDDPELRAEIQSLLGQVVAAFGLACIKQARPMYSWWRKVPAQVKVEQGSNRFVMLDATDTETAEKLQL